MKTRHLFLYMLLLLPALGLQASADINSKGNEASTNSLFPYVMTFTYDNAGNTTGIICSLQTYHLNTQKMEGESAQSLVEDYKVSINADDSWERVVVNVTGNDVEPVMNVYNLAGIRCFSETMDGISMTVNLSSLKKGVYLFQFSSGECTKTYKLTKRR